jgi:hypothetical protein
MQQLRFRNRRALASEWTAKNPTLGDGELGLEKDTRRIKFGDGFTPWNSLPYSMEDYFIPLSAQGSFALAQTLDDRTLQASASRKLVTHWGAGTSFPVIGVLQGDTCVRSDVGTNGSTWHYVGGSSGKNGWVHKGPIVCTFTTRPTAVAYDGLHIYETDTNLSRVYNAAASSWSQLQIFSDTGWVNMPSANGYTVGADGARYRVINSVGYFQMHISASTAAANAIFFTLPATARPTANHWFVAQLANVFKGELKIATTGIISFGVANTAFVCSGTFPVG